MPPRKTPFDPTLCTEFALKIVSTSDTTGQATVVKCLFCTFYGREEKVGAKRKVANTVKQFFFPFRRECFRNHHKRQHPVQWTEYQQLSTDDKKEYFDEGRVATLKTHLESDLSITYMIDFDIIQKLIGEVFFHLDDDAGTYSDVSKSRARALAIFNLDVEENMYTYKILNPAQFYIVCGMVEEGASFTQVCKFLALFRKYGKTAVVGSLNLRRVTSYVRAVCAINLQKISKILHKVWAFSIALDMSTHQSSAYLDIRIRTYLFGDIRNYHVMAVPMQGAHTGEAIFDTSSYILNILCKSWNTQMISITTDGEAKMTGHLSGVATRFEKVSGKGFFRIWCGLHQLDIALQKFFHNVMDEKFYVTMTSLIGYLRKQYSLINEMKSRAAKLCNTRWESMTKVTNWFKQHHSRIESYLKDNNIENCPKSDWWIVMFTVNSISKEATCTFRALEGMTTLVSQQREKLLELANRYADWFKVQKVPQPISLETIAAMAEQERDTLILSDTGECCMNSENMIEFFQNLSTYTLNLSETMEEKYLNETAKGLCKGVLNLIENIKKIVAERDSKNGASDQLPPVLPHQLVKLSGKEFSKILQKQKERLQARYGKHKWYEVEKEFQSLKSMHSRDTEIREKLELCTSSTNFKDGWGIVSTGTGTSTGTLFPNLRDFCGGIATAFPGTSTVESDFSVVKFEKDEYRSALTDFSLEGILHCKQFNELGSIDIN